MKSLRGTVGSEKPPLPLRNDAVQSPRRLPKSTLELLKSLILPIVAIIYLGFCYAVAAHTVPVTLNGIINTSPQHLSVVKSGVTSISILIITIGLFPLKSLLSDIKSEEFFRSLHTYSKGVPLSTLNGISNPSFGTVDAAKAISRSQVTRFFTAAFIAGFLATATSTLAPAALSIEPVLWDADMMAFKVGAVMRDSVVNISLIAPGSGRELFQNTAEAANIAWAESFLRVRYYFTQQGNLSAGIAPYIAPFPAELSTATPARWLTDVGALHPSCLWATHNVTNSTLPVTSNFSDKPTIYLAEPGLDVEFQPLIGNFSLVSMDYIDPVLAIKNHTNGARPSDGVVLWLLYECLTGCSYNDPRNQANLHLDLTGIPSFHFGNVNSTWRAAYLACNPHMTVETHEVRNDGTGQLAVRSDQHYTRQGNLHPAQTNLLLSLSLKDLGNAGPRLLSLGSKLQASMVFGLDTVNAVNVSSGDTVLKPAPLANITTAYAGLLQSTMKLFVGGKFGTVYVPGRVSKEVVVFRSSVPYVAASTALFGVLAVFVLAAHLRSGKGDKFTLFSAAAALEGSDVPVQFSQMKREAEYRAQLNRGVDKQTDEDLVESLGSRLLFLIKTGDKKVLQLQ